ncbi:MAG: response regulator [Chitinispirillaceae bacterium]|nr:response regulator [Chitinispirillaceae bacterium]
MKTTSQEQHQSDYVKISEAAELLHVDPTTVLRWIGKGYIRSTRYPSGSHRIKRSEIKRFLNESRHIKTGYKIMLIDDDEMFLSMMTDLLKEWDIPLELKTFSDGLCALLEFGSFRPDLVVLDYRLQEVNGIVLSQKIHETVNVPILLISAYMDERALRDARIAAFLKKPFTADEFRKAVETCLSITIRLMPGVQHENAVEPSAEKGVSTP